jgi:orotidine-5'-phosphate decarboxylase
MRDVIIACDFSSKEELLSFLKLMSGEKPFLKIGMELFYKEGPKLVEELKVQGYRIFLDLKLHDIPNTVYKAMRNIALLNVDITNVHAAGGIKMMQAAKQAIDEVGSNTLLIAVTQLTSISEDILHNELLIEKSMNDTIKRYAINTKEAGLVGVVCSPLEAKIMNDLGLISVTPGIRNLEDSNDDQIRVTTPRMARELGSTFIVVGRSITNAIDPLKAYRYCLKEFIDEN